MFKIAKNTDAVDIDQKCLGLSVCRDSIPSDVMGHINSNRGLHIQIRHNKDAQTYGQAIELSNLISATPEMLEALKGVIELCPYCRGNVRQDCKSCDKVNKAIAKAEGKDNEQI